MGWATATVSEVNERQPRRMHKQLPIKRLSAAEAEQIEIQKK